MGTITSWLRRLAAGPGLRGLHGAAFAEAAKPLDWRQQQALLLETQAELEHWHTKMDDADEADKAEVLAQMAQRVDRGKPPGEGAGPNMARPRSEAVARELSASASRYGLRNPEGPVSAGHVLNAMRERVLILRELLQAAFHAHPPKELLEERRALSRLKADLWQAQRDHEVAQSRYRAIRDEEAEQFVMAAAATVALASKKVHEAQQRLARGWAA